MITDCVGALAVWRHCSITRLRLVQAAARLREDVSLIWANCRAFNPPRATIRRLLASLEELFELAWDAWVVKRSGGWESWLRKSAAAIAPVPRGGRLPSIIAEAAPQQPPKRSRKFVPPPSPSKSPEEVAALPFHERQQLLEMALPNRAPPPPGWDAGDVGGCPWHLKGEFLTDQAKSAREKAEMAMKKVGSVGARGGTCGSGIYESGMSVVPMVFGLVKRYVSVRKGWKPESTQSTQPSPHLSAPPKR